HRFAIFFLTPSFATWLLDDQTFLQKAVDQAFKIIRERRKYHKKVHVLAAVVDKLPVPDTIVDAQNIAEDGMARARLPPVSETGYEGMAYAIMRDSDSMEGSYREGPEGTGSISFLTSEESESGVVHASILQLPLANTVFQTGSPTTMVYSIWEKDKKAMEFKLISRSDLTHHAIRLQSHRAPGHQNITFLSIPLIPLTLPRTVEAGMGNIVRRVVGPDQKSVVASQELEEVVPRYFKVRGEPPKSISVWALLVPDEILGSVLDDTEAVLQKGGGENSCNTDRWQALWSCDPPVWQNVVAAAIGKGARLHRVLSGGGGWGKRAGLLSLDPSVSYNALVSSPANEYAAGQASTNDLATALHRIVRPGESIQFFTSPTLRKPKHDMPARDCWQEQGNADDRPGQSTRWSWELGTIPSTADSIPNDLLQQPTPASSAVSVFRGCFGALAEGGMTLVQKSGDSAWGGLNASKIDVPFSRFGVVNV
ncbi:hypothetical protein K469DRAFT_475040, partial [Zopfia rhizophila CBS 207.26]